jgi:hypothetical protein
MVLHVRSATVEYEQRAPRDKRGFSSISMETAYQLSPKSATEFTQTYPHADKCSRLLYVSFSKHNFFEPQPRRRSRIVDIDALP